MRETMKHVVDNANRRSRCQDNKFVCIYIYAHADVKAGVSSNQASGERRERHGIVQQRKGLVLMYTADSSGRLSEQLNLHLHK